MSSPGRTPASVRRNARYYDRWRHAYDLFTRQVVPLTRTRSDAALALELSDGDHVLELGCGTGANLPYVAARMANLEGCRYTGIDIAAKAIRRVRPPEANADIGLLVGDATDPPTSPGFDAVLSTFVVTIFPDPVTVVRRWLELLAPGGRIVLVNARPTDGPGGPLLNPLFNLFVLLANPIDRSAAFESRPWNTLARRVDAVETTLAEEAKSFQRTAYFGGLVSLSVARR